MGILSEMIPKEFRYLKDTELITANCFCFGSLSSGKTGWGRPPKHLIGQYYCEGWAGHPDLIAIKEKQDETI